jgi:DNA (cytosine-5)-methyltransferase 1
LGFQAAEFEIVAAMEIDELAARSHAINFCRGMPQQQIELHAKARDITDVDPDELIKEFDLGTPSHAIDIIVGGPPCQAYARVGRAKLREIAEHPHAFKIDPRGNLYLRYLDYIKRLMPLALLMENVPDILNHGGHNIVQEMVEALDDMDYDARYSLINSAHHGVPQMRDRVFMVAFHKSLGAHIQFPAATHRCDTSAEAISDLPPITLHREGKLKRGARRFDQLLQYRKIPFDRLPAYAREMRSWQGFQGASTITSFVICPGIRSFSRLCSRVMSTLPPTVWRTGCLKKKHVADALHAAPLNGDACIVRWCRLTIPASFRTAGGSCARMDRRAL